MLLINIIRIEIEFSLCNISKIYTSTSLYHYIFTDTKNITIKFPVSKVPKQVTTYRCILFEFPQDGDYHMVATEPIIDNHDVMHHILLFGCQDSGKCV